MNEYIEYFRIDGSCTIWFPYAYMDSANIVIDYDEENFELIVWGAGWQYDPNPFIIRQPTINDRIYYVMFIDLVKKQPVRALANGC